MKEKPIRIAVAGLGRIGWRFHCAEIAASPHFELIAVADPEAPRRAEAETLYGCRAFADYDAMLKAAELDAIVIATPTHLHKRHALAAFRRGLHVFLEKPMADTLPDARSIARAARRAGRVLTVYQPRRAAAWFQQALGLIQSGQIGRLYHVRIGFFSFARRDDWQSLRRFGGGILNNYGAHALDQALILTGPRVGKLFCNMRRVASLGDTEDVVKILYQTRGGVLAEIDINQAAVLKPYEFEAFGTTGVLSKRGDQLRVASLSPKSLKPKRLNPGLAGAERLYPQDNIRLKETQVRINPRHAVNVYKDLARAIRTGARPFVRPTETLAVMKLIHQCRQAAGGIITTRL